MDYHMAEVSRATVVEGKDKGMVFYYARCKCGWRGQDRVTRRAADGDAYAHDVSENPIKR